MATEKNIKTPDDLYDYFLSYWKQIKSKPIKENIWSHKLDMQVSLEREIPLTWNGFEIYLRGRKILAKLDDYKADKDGRYSEYADIIHMIDCIIYEDKFCGATVGIYNANIIARDLGLKEKTDITTNDKAIDSVSVEFINFKKKD